MTDTLAAVETAKRVRGRNALCAGTGLGNGGTPPPWRYQRRIDTLPQRPKRSNHFRQDWLETVRTHTLEPHIDRSTGEVLAPPLDGCALQIATELGAASNNNGRDVVYMTEAALGVACRKPSGEGHSARWASTGLDQLRAHGLLDWDHGSLAQYNDADRRERLGGRWQGPCRYRLLIPNADSSRLAQRRATARSGKAPSTTPARHHKNLHPDTAKRQAAVRDAAQLALIVETFDQGVLVLQTTYQAPDLYELAYAEYVEQWSKRRPPDG